jgi:hypothetical protein
LPAPQTKELGKNACGKDGSYPALDKKAADLFKDKIKQKYRINMVLDNLPITVYDLENDVRGWGRGAGGGGWGLGGGAAAAGGRASEECAHAVSGHAAAAPLYARQPTPAPHLRRRSRPPARRTSLCAPASS